MATTIYDIGSIELIDGNEISITPLKIKYLRQFMMAFEKVKDSKNDEEAIGHLVECAVICMKQYAPEIDSVEKLEDSLKNLLHKFIMKRIQFLTEGPKLAFAPDYVFSNRDPFKLLWYIAIDRDRISSERRLQIDWSIYLFPLFYPFPFNKYKNDFAEIPSDALQKIKQILEKKFSEYYQEYLSTPL